ncbi:MAG: DEAD/DEAH box helicase family protein [Tannerellaceae bacterium]|jgi:ERCC4-related helicase|nr:DEAD/DEAH box helicase family protein [Tannerellaceae bacterium]
MLLDNKIQIEQNTPFKVVDFLKEYTENGALDIVTGFFSVNALALLYEEINQVEKFQLILGKLTKTDEEQNKVVDLLSEDFSIDSALKLTVSAKRAIEFLKQGKVSVKTIERNFCHAKSYIYTDQDNRNNYFVVGSSNLTDAGLGLRASSNIELNIAKHDHEDEYKNLCKWFSDKWLNVAADKIPMPEKRKIDVKKYIIDLIENLYREYTPYELYYKVLYERFKDDFLTYSNDSEFKKEIAHLEDTVIFQTLYPYQQKGVLSLIQMLRKHNGAILADAVGLGKTWTALAVMKYFQSKGYTVILFAPKKLRHNWEQYQCGKNSKFESDEIDYYVRNHTDLQDERLNTVYSGRDALPLARIQKKQNLLLVIDESHNLRNDKSARYQFLVDNILCPDRKKRDVKVLQLSATPINNGLIDVRNQFKLMAKGKDDGFKETDFAINSLLFAFQKAQRDYTIWSRQPNRKIADFIGNLDGMVFKLTDALIVARTRKLIEGEFGEMDFPKKETPENRYIAPANIGNLKTFDQIFDAIKIKMTAYRPSQYILSERKASEQQTVRVTEDDVKREGFLVKMMTILLVKRLESSWFSFKKTIENILAYHANALDKVNQFIDKKNTTVSISTDLSEDEQEAVEDTAAELGIDEEFTLGKKNPVELSKITSIQTFKKDLESDVNKLKRLLENLDVFERKFNENTLDSSTNDLKLEKLIEIIKEKQQKTNRKVLIFTVYSDTAIFLYEQLKRRGFRNLAYVSGSDSATSDGYSGKNFEPILERFAPYTKLYNEKDWTETYEKYLDFQKYNKDGKWEVAYEKWLKLIEKHDKVTFKKIENPVEILVATDCLSEGQNLQDCDLIINYDIHWNPVRLIQRMGRIDRLGSPNKTIRGVNFWPAKDYDDYLNLKSRVENRMAIMTVAGTEMPEDLTPELQQMVKDNPLFSKQTEKMLEQMQLTWDDIEDGDNTVGLGDLSLEQFRQELFELFKQKEEFFRNIPNGVYTGFRQFADLFQSVNLNENSLIAVLGYPRKPDDSDKDYKYDEIRLLHTSYRDGQANVSFLKNDMEILAFLRYHKSANRFVPEKVEKGDKQTLTDLSQAITDWLKAQAMPTITNSLWDNTPISPEQKKIEDKFQKENFDLITWFVISK